MGAALSTREEIDLALLEQVIDRSLASFVEVGRALVEIRERRLYRATHKTFEEYCRTRHGWGASRARQLIGAVEVVTNLESVTTVTPPSERVARALVGLPADEQREVWRQAAETASGRVVTTAHVEAALVGRKPPPSIQTRRTPLWLFDELSRRFGPFKLDAYAEPHNALCERFLTKAEDGNTAEWADVTFANPEFEDMEPPLRQALRQEQLGRRSIIVGPVGCSQEWYHRLAIRGTIYVPDCRINFDLPDGTPTNGADRDTIVMAFGRGHRNQNWERGVFHVQRLELKEAKAKSTESGGQAA